jgi:hypothetical protein
MSDGNILEPTTLMQDRGDKPSTATPWTNMASVSDSQPNVQNSARKRNGSTARRPSMMSVGMKHVRGLSKSVKSVADNELKFEAIRFAHTTTGNTI